jgi:DNA gyrase subunit B
MADFVAAQDAVRRLSHRFDPNVLEALLDMPPLKAEAFADTQALRPWLLRLEQRLAATGLGKPRYRVSAQAAEAEQGGALVIDRQHHGLGVTQLLPANLFDGGELRPILDAASELSDLIQPGAEVRRGARAQGVTSFKEAHAWLMDEAKKGRSVQRFKGLGEMNPEQLWDTTVNPETRRLLKVRIEDAVAADQIFSTLMGDVVEPRRNFIEENALKVANLDI